MDEAVVGVGEGPGPVAGEVDLRGRPAPSWSRPTGPRPWESSSLGASASARRVSGRRPGGAWPSSWPWACRRPGRPGRQASSRSGARARIGREISVIGATPAMSGKPRGPTRGGHRPAGEAPVSGGRPGVTQDSGRVADGFEKSSRRSGVSATMIRWMDGCTGERRVGDDAIASLDPAGPGLLGDPGGRGRGPEAGRPGGRRVLREGGPAAPGRALPVVPRRGEAEGRACGSTRGPRRSPAATPGPAVVPGKPEESLLVEAINYGDVVQMPPKSKLPAAEIAALTPWVEHGRPLARRRAAEGRRRRRSGRSTWRERARHWSFQPVREPAAARRRATPPGRSTRSTASSSPGSRRRASSPPPTPTGGP